MGIREMNDGRAVFLDRDGLLNRALTRNNKPYPPSTIEEVEIPEGVPEALHSLRDAGFLLLVVTNQPDVARGTQDPAALNAINNFLSERLPLDHIYVCPHDDADKCDCRKPLPGLFHRAAMEYSLTLADCYMVGDRWRDIDAGHAAGCRTVLIDYRYAERGPTRPPDQTVSSLPEAAAWILQHAGVNSTAL